MNNLRNKFQIFFHLQVNVNSYTLFIIGTIILYCYIIAIYDFYTVFYISVDISNQRKPQLMRKASLTKQTQIQLGNMDKENVHINFGLNIIIEDHPEGNTVLYKICKG